MIFRDSSFGFSQDGLNWRTYICQRLWEQTQPSLLPDATVSAPRFGRVCSLMRMRLLPDADAPAPAFAAKP